MKQIESLNVNDYSADEGLPVSPKHLKLFINKHYDTKHLDG